VSCQDSMESHGVGHGQFSSGFAFRGCRNLSSMMHCAPAGSRCRSIRANDLPLSAWNGQHGHDLDGIARENGKVRMPVEELGSGLMRIRAHNRECAHVIARIVEATLRDLLGFP